MAAALALSGCFYGYGTDVSVTRLTDAAYPPTESITLYFRPIAKDERCVPIALLEAAGSRSEDTADALREMRREAVEVGADSIFSVTPGRAERAQGELLSELDPKNHPTYYSSHLVTGLAARCDVRTTADTRPPTDAYGASFGASVSDIVAQCRAQGASWSPVLSRCSGVPGSGRGSVAFGFCGDKLCKVDVTGAVDAIKAEPSLWPAEFVRASERLSKRYGIPSAQRSWVPSSCKPARFLEYVGAGKADYTYQWKWATGESVWLLLTSEGGRPVVRVVYDVSACSRSAAG
jgi:hypothetical protein